jgi:uncharacterized protein YecT (DUF1311 family)
MKPFHLLFLTAFSFSSYASNSTIDCKSPINMQQTRACEERSMQQVQLKMEKQVQLVSQKLPAFSGKQSAKNFVKLQKSWLKLVDEQCANQRLLYGRGSMAGISVITCHNYFYKARIKTINTLYKEVMSIP